MSVRVYCLEARNDDDESLYFDVANSLELAHSMLSKWVREELEDDDEEPVAAPALHLWAHRADHWSCEVSGYALTITAWAVQTRMPS